MIGINETKWMFFDLGGTLIDESKPEKYIISTIITEFKKYGVIYSNADVYQAMKIASINYKSVKKEAIRILSKTQEQYNDIVEKVVYVHELERLYPYTVETLEQLSRRFQLGIIANQALGTEERMKEQKIHKYFSVFALSSELGISKPDSRIFKYALSKANCLPQNAYMIGDRLDNDIYPANFLDMNTIRVLQGIAKYQRPLNKEYEPDYVFDSIGKLLTFANEMICCISREYKIR